MTVSVACRPCSSCSSDEAGLHYEVSLETSPGKDLKWHIDHETPVLDHAYDHVILQSYSTLDAKTPGDPAGLIPIRRGLGQDVP